MKKIIIIFMILLSGCKKLDDSDKVCMSHCTTLRGEFVSLNNEPVPNVKVSLKYFSRHEAFIGGSIRKIVNTRSGQDGRFYKDFFIKDKELGDTRGYFLLEVDDSEIDVVKYIRTKNLAGSINEISFPIYSITNRDTIIEKSFYIPKKAFIKVNLNNFLPQKPGDRFEVQTFYPFGPKVGFNTFLDSPYSTGFNGYGTWIATDLNNQHNVFVAEGEKNVIRILKIKNGIASHEDLAIKVPPANTIELTYNF